MKLLHKIDSRFCNLKKSLSFWLLFLASLVYGLALSATVVQSYHVPINPGLDTFILQGETRDVGVSSIVQVGPPFANEGDTVTIQVGVVNNGTGEEAFSVNLHDNTENKAIDSREITLAASSSTTLSFEWDTRGASGGPAPPGPPTPGTIHVLTASAVLEGDTDSSNNFLSLLPGIWIIAAPKAPEITFPEPLEIPQAELRTELPSEVPLIQTERVALSSTFVGPVQGLRMLKVSDASIQTEEKALSGLFNGPVDGSLNISMEDPNLGTQGKELSNVFTAGVQSKVIDNFANPNIETTPELLTRILADNTEARADKFLVKPGIDTEIAPLTRILIDDVDNDSLSTFASPPLQTQAEPLTDIFYSEIEANHNQFLSVPAIITYPLPLTEIISVLTQGRVLNTLSTPAIDTGAIGLTDLFISPLTAKSIRGSSGSDIDTSAVPLSIIYPGSVQARLAHSIRKPEVVTEPVPLSRPHVFGGAVTYQSGQALARPFAGATITGRIKLQSVSSSLGSYMTIGDKVTFADRDGRFEASAPTETFDLYIRAPGHIPVIVPDITLDSGESLAIPEVTLLFGDGNGDGIVNIYDLAVAAFNYGESVRTLKAP